MVDAAHDAVFRGGSGSGSAPFARRTGNSSDYGVANTVLCVKLFGVASGVELFLVPCVVLAAILFRSRERATMALVLSLPFAAYLGLDGNLGPPVKIFSAEEYSSIVAMHAVSVAALTIVIGLLFASMLYERKL